MSATCQHVVGIDDDDRRAFPAPIYCPKAASANVEPGRDSEYVACDEHAAQAARDGAVVQPWL